MHILHVKGLVHLSELIRSVPFWGKEKDLQNLDGLTEIVATMLNHAEGPDQSGWKNKKNYQ